MQSYQKINSVINPFLSGIQPPASILSRQGKFEA